MLGGTQLEGTLFAADYSSLVHLPGVFNFHARTVKCHNNSQLYENINIEYKKKLIKARLRLCDIVYSVRL
jgi:hypothetical protein